MLKKPVVFNLFSAQPIYDFICDKLNYEAGEYELHQFPDEEILFRFKSIVTDRPVIVIATLNQPNSKIMPLLFAAETLRELGATKIGLVAPYLAYMRQDKQFHTGEGITSKYFAKVISTYFDWLITIDSHLHRWHTLNDIYTIPTKNLSASTDIAEWIKNHIKQPVLIGPDKESTQWVSNIADRCEAPYLIVEKKRISDTNISATIPKLDSYVERTPVVIDDIISTAATMIETVKHIQLFKMKPITCIGVHAIFANDAYEKLTQIGVDNVITCNTISHQSNQIDISQLIVDAIKDSGKYHD